MNIAICEDHSADAALLYKLVEDYCAGHNTGPATYSLFPDGTAFLNTFCAGIYDIVFLDILFRKNAPSGVEVAKCLREQDRNCQIVFTTISPDFALDAFHVAAAHYLTKPVTAEKIAFAMDRCREMMQKRSSFIPVCTGRLVQKIYLHNLAYVDVYNNICTFHLDHAPFGARMTMTEVEERIAETPAAHSFLRCHRSYLVNMARVERFEDDCFVMDTGERVQIRQYNKLPIRKAYEQFVLSELRK